MTQKDFNRIAYDKLEKLEWKVEKLENDRKITGAVVGILIVAVIYLIFF